MMSASCGTEIASMCAAVGEKIVGRQLECRRMDGRTAFQLYIYDYILRNLQVKDKNRTYIVAIPRTSKRRKLTVCRKIL